MASSSSLFAVENSVLIRSTREVTSWDGPFCVFLISLKNNSSAFFSSFRVFSTHFATRAPRVSRNSGVRRGILTSTRSLPRMVQEQCENACFNALKTRSILPRSFTTTVADLNPDIVIVARVPRGTVPTGICNNSSLSIASMFEILLICESALDRIFPILSWTLFMTVAVSEDSEESSSNASIRRSVYRLFSDSSFLWRISGSRLRRDFQLKKQTGQAFDGWRSAVNIRVELNRIGNIGNT